MKIFTVKCILDQTILMVHTVSDIKQRLHTVCKKILQAKERKEIYLSFLIVTYRRIRELLVGLPVKKLMKT